MTHALFPINDIDAKSLIGSRGQYFSVSYLHLPLLYFFTHVSDVWVIRFIRLLDHGNEKSGIGEGDREKNEAEVILTKSDPKFALLLLLQPVAILGFGID